MAVVLAIAVAWTPSAVFGGVSNLSQERTVTATIEDSAATETHRSDKTGKFDKTAKEHFMNELGDHDDVMTSQTSTIGNNFVSAHGSYDANSQGEVLAYSRCRTGGCRRGICSRPRPCRPPAASEEFLCHKLPDDDFSPYCRDMVAKAKQPRQVPDFRLMYQLAERYSEASQLLDEQAKGSAYGCSGPMVMVDSFAVELYLKCLHVLDNNEAPPRRGSEAHDWKKLFDGLKSSTKSLIRGAFDESVRKDPVLQHLEFINPQAPRGLTDFDTSLQVAARTFDQRRYLYEERDSTDWFYAHLVREAIRNVTKLDLRLHSPSNSP